MRYFKTTTIDKVGGVTTEVEMVRTIEFHLDDDSTIETNYIIHPLVVRIMDFPLLRGDREEDLPTYYSEISRVDGEPVWKEIFEPEFNILIQGLRRVYKEYRE